MRRHRTHNCYIYVLHCTKVYVSETVLHLAPYASCMSKVWPKPHVYSLCVCGVGVCVWCVCVCVCVIIVGNPQIQKSYTLRIPGLADPGHQQPTVNANLQWSNAFEIWNEVCVYAFVTAICLKSSLHLSMHKWWVQPPPRYPETLWSIPESWFLSVHLATLTFFMSSASFSCSLRWCSRYLKVRKHRSHYGFHTWWWEAQSMSYQSSWWGTGIVIRHRKSRNLSSWCTFARVLILKACMCLTSLSGEVLDTG